MSHQWSWRARLCTVALLAVVIGGAGCASKPPKPEKAWLTVAAQPDVNPDASGRPSPIVLRVYQLKDDAAFRDADFFAIFDKEQATLAASLVGRQEFELGPGEQHRLDYALSGDTKFIAAVAAFRDIRNAEWRVLAGAPKKGVKNVVKRHTVSVTVDKSRVTLAVAD